MKLTKEQVKMIKGDSETTTIKHGYDMTIIDLCTDWLEMAKCGEVEFLLTLDKIERLTNMREKQRELGMITSEEAIELSKGLAQLTRMN